MESQPYVGGAPVIIDSNAKFAFGTTLALKKTRNIHVALIRVFSQASFDKRMLFINNHGPWTHVLQKNVERLNQVGLVIV